MAKAKKKVNLSLKEKLELALVSVDEQPYEVPENWCWVKNNIICQLGDGVKSEGETLPYLEVKYLRGVKEAENLTKGKLIEVGTKVILVDGENSGEVFDIHESGYMGSTFKTLVIANGVYDKYLLYFIHSNRELLRNNKTGSAIPHLNKKLFFDLNFPFPPLAEQKRIVEQIENLFAKLDEAKEITEKALSSFELRRSALLYKAFNGELTDEWRSNHSGETASDYLERISKEEEYTLRSSLKYWNNSKLPEGWCESKIGDLLYYAGRIGWKGLKAEEYTEEGPLLLSVYNLNDGDEVSYHKVYHITEERYEESPEIMVQIGDVLLTKDGAGIGKLGYVKELPERATINSSLLLIRPGKLAESKYIFYLLSGPTMQSIVKERITGSATPHLFQRDIKEFVIPIPPIDEQRQIVKVLDEMFLKETQAYEELKVVSENIDLMKKSILAKAFRGELGTNNPGEESAVELLKQIITEE